MQLMHHHRILVEWLFGEEETRGEGMRSLVKDDADVRNM